MVEGTRTFRGKKSAADSATTQPSILSENPPNATTVENPERRELFQQMVPMAGESLVKILRESNLLKNELKRLWQRR